MQLAGLDGRAEVRDVIHNPPQEPADLALLLKTLPCLEQVEKGAVHSPVGYAAGALPFDFIPGLQPGRPAKRDGRHL